MVFKIQGEGKHRIPRNFMEKIKDGDKDATDCCLIDILLELTEYSADDIYNVEETGIYYHAIPDSAHEIASRSKKCKGLVKCSFNVCRQEETNNQWQEQRS